MSIITGIMETFKQSSTSSCRVRNIIPENIRMAIWYRNENQSNFRCNCPNDLSDLAQLFEVDEGLLRSTIPKLSNTQPPVDSDSFTMENVEEYLASIGKHLVSKPSKRKSRRANASANSNAGSETPKRSRPDLPASPVRPLRLDLSVLGSEGGSGNAPRVSHSLSTPPSIASFESMTQEEFDRLIDQEGGLSLSGLSPLDDNLPSFGDLSPIMGADLDGLSPIGADLGDLFPHNVVSPGSIGSMPTTPLGGFSFDGYMTPPVGAMSPSAIHGMYSPGSPLTPMQLFQAPTDAERFADHTPSGVIPYFSDDDE